MDPVSQADRLAALLRERLLERARAAGTAGAARERGAGAPVDRVYASGPVQPRDERQMRRTLIQTILSQEFGGALINDAGFQQVIDRVLGAIEADEQASALIARVAKDVGGG